MRGEGVHGPRPSHCAQRGRMSGRRAGCPGLHEMPDVRALGPDVRAGGVGFCALWIEGAGFPGFWPDFRAGRRMSGPCSTSMAGLLLLLTSLGGGCPAAVAACTSSFSFLCSRAHLALVLGLSMVSSGVPEYAQGPRLK